MVAPVGFWSYVHADDEGDQGRVVQLAHDIIAEMGLLTGEDIELFLDRDAIKWGDRWRSVVDEGLAKVAFFIPVLTPRYFTRAECRNELQSFARRADQLGVKQLVMPLLYTDLPAIHEDAPTDDLVALVKDFQWESWIGLRLSDRSSSEYRQGVSRLAARLVDANAAAEVAASASLTVLETRGASPPSPDAVEDDDSEPGIIDVIAATEDALPAWGETVSGLGAAVGTLGELFTSATLAFKTADARGAGMSGRLHVARELARDLVEPVDKMYSLANDFTTQLHTIDIGTQAMIEGLTREVGADPSQADQVCASFQVIRDFESNVTEGLVGVTSMATGLPEMEGMSRDLRPPFRRLRQALTLLAEAQAVVGAWTKLMDDSGVNCGP